MLKVMWPRWGEGGVYMYNLSVHWTHLAIMMIFRTTMMILLGVMITFGRFSYSHFLALNLFLFHSYLSCCSL